MSDYKILEINDNYLATDCGNIKRISSDKFIKGMPDKDGYLRITLCKNNKKITKSVHRLVAQSFIPNPENKPQVNHINGIKHDNRVENLEWCTNSENQLHAHKIGLKVGIGNKGEKAWNSKLTNEMVFEIRAKYIPKKYSHRKLSKEYGVDHRVIGKIIKRELWSHI